MRIFLIYHVRLPDNCAQSETYSVKAFPNNWRFWWYILYLG